jgi:hypothetical protein
MKNNFKDPANQTDAFSSVKEDMQAVPTPVKKVSPLTQTTEVKEI